MPIRLSIVSALLPALLLAVACQPTPDQPALPATLTPTAAMTTVTIGVAASAAAVTTLTAPDAVDGVALRWVVTSSAALYADLAAGQLDALLVHAVPDGAADYFVSPIAVDGIVLIVHPDNPLQGVTRGEAQALFSGQITNWSSIGGADRPVLPISRERGSGLRDLFNQRVLGGQRVVIGAPVVADPDGVRRAVAADPGAIGYVTLGSLPPGTTDPALAVRQLAIDGVTANPATTAAQQYALSVPLYWVSPAEPTGAPRALLAYWQSPAGQTALGARFGRVVP